MVGLVQGDKMNISIIGSGYVGYATGKGFHELGHNVLFHDNNMSRLEELKKQGYTTNALLYNALAEKDLAFICIPTPEGKNGKTNLTLMHVLFRAINEAMGMWQPSVQRPELVIRSTVPIGTTRTLAEIINERSRAPVSVYHNPEFLQQATANQDFMNPERIVIGTDNEGFIDSKLFKLYGSFNVPLIAGTYEESEAIKYINNCWYAANISFWNEMNQMLDMKRCDRDLVRQAVQKGKGFGTHPWHTGTAYGGACLPKEMASLTQQFKSKKLPCPVLEAITEVNDRVKKGERNGPDAA